MTLALALTWGGLAVAAEWWVPDQPTADALVSELVDLWPEAHEVRVGAGEGFVFEPGTLTWVGDTEVQHREVSGLRAAVVLARSWDQADVIAGVGWLPADLVAPARRSSVRVLDLDGGADSGVWFLGGLARVRYGAGFGFQLRREGPVQLAVEAVGTPSLRGESRDSVGMGPADPLKPRASLDLAARADWDVVPGPVRMAVGAAVTSHHEAGGTPGAWVAARPSIEAGVVVNSWTLAARADHPLVRSRSTLPVGSDPQTRVGGVIRAGNRFPMELTGGVAGKLAETGPVPWGQLAVWMDLGGWQ